MRLVVLLLFLASGVAHAQISANALRKHVDTLCSDKFAGRGSGEIGEFLAANYIRDQFRSIGLTTQEGYPDYFQNLRFTKRTREAYERRRNEQDRDTLYSQNVIGIIPARADSRFKGESVVIFANYDHLGHGIWSHRMVAGNKDIFRGADDNASGVAGLIELARYLHTHRDSIERTIYIIALGAGEEERAAGLRYWIDDVLCPFDGIRAGIELNSIGRYDDTIFVGGYFSSPWFKTVAGELMEATGGEVFTMNLTRHEQASIFDMAMKPHLTITTASRPEHHTTRDVPERLVFEPMARITETAARIALRIANSTEPMPFTELRTLTPASIGEAGEALQWESGRK